MTTAPAKKAAAAKAPVTSSTFEQRAAINNAQAWMPKENDVLEGILVGVREVKGTDYSDYPALIFETKDGYRAFHVFHGVARERLSEIQPKRGDTLKILYLGVRTANKPIMRNGKEEENNYHAYYIEAGEADETAGLAAEYEF